MRLTLTSVCVGLGLGAAPSLVDAEAAAADLKRQVEVFDWMFSDTRAAIYSNEGRPNGASGDEMNGKCVEKVATFMDYRAANCSNTTSNTTDCVNNTGINPCCKAAEFKADAADYCGEWAKSDVNTNTAGCCWNCRAGGSSDVYDAMCRLSENYVGVSVCGTSTSFADGAGILPKGLGCTTKRGYWGDKMKDGNKGPTCDFLDALMTNDPATTGGAANLTQWATDNPVFNATSGNIATNDRGMMVSMNRMAGWLALDRAMFAYDEPKCVVAYRTRVDGQFLAGYSKQAAGGTAFCDRNVTTDGGCYSEWGTGQGAFPTNDKSDSADFRLIRAKTYAGSIGTSGVNIDLSNKISIAMGKVDIAMADNAAAVYISTPRRVRVAETTNSGTFEIAGTSQDVILTDIINSGNVTINHGAKVTGVRITNSGPITVDACPSGTCTEVYLQTVTNAADAAITVGNGAISSKLFGLTNAGNVTIGKEHVGTLADVTNSGTVNVGQGGTFTLTGVSNSGTVDIAGGAITGKQISNTGTISFGNSTNVTMTFKLSSGVINIAGGAHGHLTILESSGDTINNLSDNVNVTVQTPVVATFTATMAFNIPEGTTVTAAVATLNGNTEVKKDMVTVYVNKYNSARVGGADALTDDDVTVEFSVPGRRLTASEVRQLAVSTNVNVAYEVKLGTAGGAAADTALANLQASNTALANDPAAMASIATDAGTAVAGKQAGFSVDTSVVPTKAVFSSAFMLSASAFLVGLSLF